MDRIERADIPGATKVQSAIQTVLLIAVSIITAWTLHMVPSWQAPGDPFLLAAVAGAVAVACLWLARRLGSRAIKFERTMLAGFLVAMPLVYVMGWFAARDHATSSWIWVELLGLALFAAFAALGLKNSPWFLAIGIAGHGFAWDPSWTRSERQELNSFKAAQHLIREGVRDRRGTTAWENYTVSRIYQRWKGKL